MKKYIFLIICLLLHCSAALAAQDEENLEMVNRVIVGDFKLNLSKVTESMYEQLLNGISHIDMADDLQVKIFAHTDKSGPVAFNKKLAQKRVESIEKTLFQVFGKNICCLETRAMIYEPGVNEVDRRYAVIEFWKSKATVNMVAAPVQVSAVGPQREKEVLERTEKKIEDQLAAMAKLSEEQVVKSYDVRASNQQMWGLAIFIFLLILAIIGLLLYIISLLKQRRNYPSPSYLMGAAMMNEPYAEQEPDPVIRKPSVEDFVIDDSSGNEYRVPCFHFEDAHGLNHYISPFVYASGEVIDKGTEEDMRISLRKCLTRSQFSDQKEQLINRQLIKLV